MMNLTGGTDLCEVFLITEGLKKLKCYGWGSVVVVYIIKYVYLCNPKRLPLSK